MARLYRCPRRTAGKVISDYRIFCQIREDEEKAQKERLAQKKAEKELTKSCTGA